MQEVIDENPQIIVQSMPTAGSSGVRKMILKFGQIYVTKPPVYTESDGRSITLYPNEARIRDLTYACNIYIDVTKIVENEFGERDEHKFSRTSLGQLPIMLRSSCCILHGLTEKDILMIGECPYDQGGYFIVTGSEKVIVAQERMASNHVQKITTSTLHSLR
jgi:DNA-directed RNA polymerase II subunit RPB2